MRDLPRALGRRVGDELFWGRAGGAGRRGGGGAARLVWGDLIALLGTFAFGTFGAALAPALAVGLNWDRVTPAAAGASIATGLVLNLALELFSVEAVAGPARLPAAVSLAASFTVLFAVTWWTSREGGGGLAPEVRAVIDS